MRLRPFIEAACVLAIAGVVPPALAYGLWDPAARHSYLQSSPQQFSSQEGLAVRFRNSAIRWLWSHPSSCENRVAPEIRENSWSQYRDDVVLRFNLSSAAESIALGEAANTLFLDVWQHTGSWVDVRIAKATVPVLLEMLPESLQHAYNILIRDLAQSVFESLPGASSLHDADTGHDSFDQQLHTTPEQDNVFFRDYQPLSVIHPWMRLMQSLFPTHARLIKIGTTAEGRDIISLRVGVHPTNAQKPSTPRKTIIISAGAHAREWVSVAALNYAAYSLITGYGRSAEQTKLIEAFDWIFIPTINPDGYVFTWDHDRLWRKNRQITNLPFCKGLDVDRSFSFQWEGADLRGNPCSESYAGEAPLDAIEAQQLTQWIKNETEHGNTEFIGFLDLHSYSQQILYPFAYSCIATPPTLENLEELGLGLAKAIRMAGGRTYDVASACEGSVAVSEDASTAPEQNSHAEKPHRSLVETGGGSALDYMYHQIGVRYAYQIKLRDRGNYGFLLPKKDIVPSGKEVAAAVTYFGRFLLGDKGIERGESMPSGRRPDVHMRPMPDEGGKANRVEQVDGTIEEHLRNDNERNGNLEL